MLRAQCVVCGKEMQFVEGDLIFGDSWYHKVCSENDFPAESHHSQRNIS